jgi:hypothetical protein
MGPGIRLHMLDSNRDFCRGHSDSRSKDRVQWRRARMALHRGLSHCRITGRLPVDVDAGISWRFPEGIRERSM